MAENTPLYMDINNVYSGDELGLPYRDIMGEGIIGAGDLTVTAGTGNTINVAGGSGWVLGDTDINRQPTYRIYNDATVNKGITPDPTNPRYVRVVAQINDATFSGATRNWQIVAIHGTPAGSPAVPALPVSALDLATVLVPAAAASSAAYTFTDNRKRAVVGGGQAVSSAGGPSARVALTAPQAMSNNVLTSIAFSAANWLNGGITFGSSALTVPVSGIYLMSVALNWAANAAGTVRYTELRRQNNLAVLQEAQGDYRSPIAGGFFSGMLVTTVMSANGGDTFYVQVQQDSGGSLNVNNATMSVTKIAVL